MISLTQEQRDAVAASHPNLVIRAAAGAGKTRVLVERFLKHVVEDSARPDQILAITFTRKAAAEMKKRIVERLKSAGLIEEAQIAETGPIQTIHGFCERTLKECCVDAGIDPDFTILDESEGARLIESAIHEAIAAVQPATAEDKLVELLAGKRERGAVSPHARLIEALRAALEQLRGTAHSIESLEQTHRDPKLLVDRWKQIWIECLDANVRECFENDNLSEPFELRLRLAHKKLRRAVPQGLARDVEEALAHEEAMLRDAELSCGLVRMACSSWRTFEERMKSLRTLDFTLLEERAVELLERSEPVQERLRRQYRFALVDEAQDLSPLQYKLLASLGLATEMLVGDAQQSIYGFRQAEVRLFHERAQRAEVLYLSKNFRSAPGILAFVDHIFQREWGADYVPMHPSANGEAASQSGDKSRHSESAAHPFDAPPSAIDGVEIWEQKVQDTGQISEWIGKLIEEGAPAGDIAVLVRKSSYAQDLLMRLEALNVPARIVGGTERFYTRLEVRDLANALRAMADPSDDFALLATLRSPIAGLSLDSIALLALSKPVSNALFEFIPPVAEDVPILARFLKWFDTVKGRADRLSAWEALSIVFSESPYLENLARKPNASATLANVRKLLRLAAASPEVGPLEFSKIVREIRELRHREGDAPFIDDDANAITILTVHKAKGLEFPVVVLPDLFGRAARNMGDLEIDKWAGLVSTGYCESKSAFHCWMAAKRRERELAEAMRVLYVGMTRAKSKLCVACHPQVSTTHLAGKVAELLGLKDGMPKGVLVRSPSIAN